MMSHMVDSIHYPPPPLQSCW